LVSGVVEQWRRVADGVAALPDAAFATPSRLPGWTVADLVVHIAGVAAALRRATSPDYPTGRAAPAEIADPAREEVAGLDPAEVRARLRGDIEAAAAHLAGADLDDLVRTPGGRIRLGEFLASRAVEGVVHGLDLGVRPARDALRITVRTLAGILAAKAPGRSVELRVPPFTAVQIVAGPRHTRGTPPGVVEATPEAFVELAAGRLPWADAVADGRVTVSGERADLRPFLPLL
jgi:uncharacterized protein (TIGR03083 family)